MAGTTPRPRCRPPRAPGGRRLADPLTEDLRGGDRRAFGAGALRRARAEHRRNGLLANAALVGAGLGRTGLSCTGLGCTGLGGAVLGRWHARLRAALLAGALLRARLEPEHLVL